MGGFSNGVYSRYFSWTNDANNNIDINAGRMDTEDNGFATGLSTCLLKDGSQTVTNNIPFAGFRLTNVGASQALTDAPQSAQVQNQAFQIVSSVAGTNTITGNTVPSFATYATGQVFRFIPANTITGAATLNLNGISAVSIKKRARSGLVNVAAFDITTGVMVQVMYDGTYFVLDNIGFGGAAVENLNTVIVDDGSGNLTIGAGQVTDAMLAAVSGSGSVVLATSPTLITPALGTPASGVLTNCTGTASGLTAGNVTNFPLMTALGVGSIILAYSNSTSAGSQHASSFIQPINITNAGGLASSGDSISGTWQAMMSVANTSYVTIWQRVA